MESGEQAQAPDSDPQIEPRWPSVLGMLAVGGLSFALPRNLAFGPNWLLLVLVIFLTVPLLITHRRGQAKLNRVLGFMLSGLITVALVWSVGALIAYVPTHHQSAGSLLLSATVLWMSNILVFASWYWRLDAGGPHARDQRTAHDEGAFLFPQMTQAELGDGWKPGFVDYLFLAFNTSTAFSPTDVPVLTHWAKLLMMAQSLLSLCIVAILVSRATSNL